MATECNGCAENDIQTSSNHMDHRPTDLDMPNFEISDNVDNISLVESKLIRKCAIKRRIFVRDKRPHTAAPESMIQKDSGKECHPAY